MKVLGNNDWRSKAKIKSRSGRESRETEAKSTSQ
jgi:hypothetical protein